MCTIRNLGLRRRAQVLELLKRFFGSLPYLLAAVPTLLDFMALAPGAGRYACACSPE